MGYEQRAPVGSRRMFDSSLDPFLGNIGTIRAESMLCAVGGLWSRQRKEEERASTHPV